MYFQLIHQRKIIITTTPNSDYATLRKEIQSALVASRAIKKIRFVCVCVCDRMFSKMKSVRKVLTQ